ncbi:hypothetical protein [Clostridium sp. YIM B02555]|uniref:hypothetical protein n=1 Tax=Clostridium sp. YIM B02555 TaxID=2911968 RepID=UPI001EEDA49A|nr:hypothetical protein [Clostridium sp. YIM B02555]
MSGFNVETYEIFKKKNSTANEANYDNLSNRVTVLENNLMSINSTFTYDFSNDDYIDFYKSTVTMTSKGIIPKQYLKTTFIDFNKDDSYVDYDNSSDIKWQDNKVSLSSTSDLTGTLRLSSIDVDNAVGMRFDCDYKNKDTISSISPQEIRNSNLWFVSEVDNFGRLWVLSSEQFSYGATNKVHMVIYNKDMTVYKSYDLANSAVFDTTDTNANYPIFGPCDIKFTEENVCILVTRLHSGVQNGYGTNTWTSPIDTVVLINENGQTNKIGYYQGYYLYNNTSSGQLHSIYGGQKPTILIKDDIIFILTGSYCFHQYDYYSNQGRGGDNRNFIAYKMTGSLSESLTNIQLIKQQYNTLPSNNDWWDNNTLQCVSGFSSNGFIQNGYFNVILNAHKSAYTLASSVSVSSLYSLQLGIDVNQKVFNCLASNTSYDWRVLKDAVSDPGVINNTPAFNAVYYGSNDKLYILSNFINDKTANLRRYDVSWDSRTGSYLTITNTINNTIQLETCSHSLEISNSTILDVNKNNYNKFMEVIEFDNQLHLFYMAPTSDTVTRLCLKYMAFDMDLNQTIEETILWQQQLDTVMLQKFDISVFNGELLILYSVGNNADYTVNNANSKIYSIKIGKVTSNIKFYYLDDVKRIWTNINSGDEAKFDGPVSKITMKAVLESDTYNCSPTINNMTIQTWNNNNGVSRQSEYCSKRIEEVQDDGKGVLSADYEENDGVIDWFVSYDGGNNYNKINLNEEFVFTHLDAPDFRVKAVMSVTDNAKKLPIIHSYTLKTTSLVLHSDLEEIQINLIKTNFKIDTYTKASKNGLMKMTIDTLSDENFIDQSNSKYTFYNSYGYAGGNYLQTKPEEVNEKVKSILLSVDEICENPNSKIVYSASADGGATFKEIKPNVKTQLTNTNSEKDQIVMKAVFYEGAKLNAWGWAWD